MFGSSKNDHQKLEVKYKKLMEESFRLSRTDRKKSDLKRAEAEEVLTMLNDAKKNSG